MLRNLIGLIILFVLFCGYVEASNYVRLSDSGRYFQHEDGTDFLPIGHNEGIDWPYIMNIYPYPIVGTSYLDFDPVGLRNYFNMLHNHGVNVIRIMTDAPASPFRPGGIEMEDPVRVFHPDMILFLDTLFQLAEQYKIYIMVTPYDTYWMNLSWDEDPYNAMNGGPVHEKHDFLTSAQCIEYQKNRIKFLIDRYGNSDYVFAWDILNELDIWWSTSEEEELRFVDLMTSFICQYERQKWGKNHLICVSTAEANPAIGAALNYANYKHPNVDFPTTHMYYSAVNNPPNTIAPAIAVNEGIKFQLSQIPTCDPRPYIDSESGPISSWPQARDFDDELFHNMIWAHLASGGAGGGFRWPYRDDPHTLTDTMHDYQLAMSRIAKHIRWSDFASYNIDDVLTVTNTERHKVIAMGCSDSRTALVWLLQDSRETTGIIPQAALTVGGMSEGTFRVLYFNSSMGRLIKEEFHNSKTGYVSVNLPTLRRDLVVIMKNEMASSIVNRKPEGFITEPITGQATENSTITLTTDVENAITQVDFYAYYEDENISQNILPNTSFENKFRGGPASWWGHTWQGSATYSHEASGRTGKHSVVIDSSLGTDASWQTMVRVQPNTSYRLSGWLKTKDIFIQNGHGAFMNLQDIAGTTAKLTGDNDWTPVNMTFNSGARSVVLVNCSLGGSGLATGRAQFDDIRLEPLLSAKTWRCIGSDTMSPFSIDWDITSVPDQEVSFAIGLTNEDGQTIFPAKEIHGVFLEHQNGDQTSPFGSIEWPPVDRTIPAGSLTLQAAVWDRSSGVHKVQYWIKGTPTDPRAEVNTLLGEVLNPPYTLDANLEPFDGTTRWISLDIFDRAGNSSRPSDLHTNVIIDSANDTSPPQAKILEPLDGAVITSLPITLSATASDLGSGVNKVEFQIYYNGTWHSVGIDSIPPYSVLWDSTITNQKIMVRVDVFDNAGNSQVGADLSGGIFYEVMSGDTFIPWCHIVSPDSFSEITLPFNMKAMAGDENSGVDAVTFKYYFGGTWNVIGMDSIPPYEILWDGNELPDGSFVQIGVDVIDHAGNAAVLSDYRSEIMVHQATKPTNWQIH